MIILNGKKIADGILDELKEEIRKKRLKLKLAVVFIGENPASAIFVREKKKACRKIGIDFQLFRFPAKIDALVFQKEIKKIVKNPRISGMIIQLPLPERLKTQQILNLILKKKNVEFFSPVVCAVDCFLKEYKISLRNKIIVLIGRGRLVGRPLAIWLGEQKIKFSDISKIKQADIIISGVGKPNLITGEMVKKGAVIIDAGTTLINGKIAGDIDFKSVSKKAGYITPVPGGVGPLTVVCLLENLVKMNR